MKKLLLLLFVGLSLTASAQWQGISGTPQKNTSTGAVRWNFGANGVSMMITSVDTSRTSGGATFNPTTGVLSIPKTSNTASNGLTKVGNDIQWGGFNTLTSNVILSMGTNQIQFTGVTGPNSTVLNLTPGNTAFMWSENGGHAELSLVGNSYSILRYRNSLTQNATIQLTTLGQFVQDEITTTGLRNTNSYATNGKRYNTWLAEWGAVKSRIDSAITANATYTASGGITKTGSNFTLGGSIATGNTIIDATASGSSFWITSTPSGFATTFQLQSQLARLVSSDASNHSTSFYINGPTDTYWKSVNGSSPAQYRGIEMSTTSFVVNDGVANKGMSYAGRYEVNYTGLSLVDKIYTDSTAKAKADSVKGTYAPVWSAITGKPTTLPGYGITDAYPLTGNPSGFLTGITGGQVTTALGFTPYNSTNPSGYITSSALSPYATLASPTFTGTVTLPIAGGSFKLNTTATGVLTTTDGAGTMILAAMSGTGNAVMTGSPSIVTPTLTIPNITGGYWTMTGTSSGTVTFRAQAAAGTYSWNYPITAGTSGYFLTSGGGGLNAMTWTNMANYAFGSPTATTQAALDNSTKLATTAYADAAVNATATYFSASLFGGLGTSGSPYTLGTGIVGISNLSATGTADGSHFLAGDNTWKTISGSTYTNGTGLNLSSNTFSIDQTFTPTWTGKHIFSVTNTASSASNYGTVLSHTVNQTGTAAFTDFYVNRTNTAPGSGSQFLAEFAVGGSTKFSINTNGGITSASSVTINGTFTNQQFSSSSTFSADGLYLYNSQTASSGNPSLNSLRSRYMASVWNTTATPAANYASIINEMRTASGTSPGYTLYWAANLSTTTTPGTFSDIASLDNFGDFKAYRSIGAGEITFANRPTSPYVGMTCNFSDSTVSTFGGSIAGSGTNHVSGRWNGTNWTVTGI